MPIGMKRFIMTTKPFKSPDGGANGGGTDPNSSSNGQGEAITLNSVQQYVSENEDAKKWLQSQKDTYLTAGLKTWQENNLSKLVEDEIAKRYPPETEAEKKLRELEDKFAKAEREKVKESLVNKALKIATEKKLPVELVEYFVGDSEEVTIANMGNLEKIFETAVNVAVENRFKGSGRDPKGTQGGNTGNSDKGIAMQIINNMGQQTNLDEARKKYF